MSGLKDFLTPTYILTLLAVAVFLILVLTDRIPSAKSWQEMLDSLETKGGQLFLLWFTDMILISVLVHYWHSWDASLQTSIVGILSAVNGASLGAVGAKTTSNSAVSG